MPFQDAGRVLHLLYESKAANKTVVDNRLPAPSRNDPLDYNP